MVAVTQSCARNVWELRSTPSHLLGQGPLTSSILVTETNHDAKGTYRADTSQEHYITSESSSHVFDNAIGARVTRVVSRYRIYHVMSSKRHSILPPTDRSGPKPPVIFSSSLTISENAVLQGTHSITIQSESVVHPRCRIESFLGSVLVGRRCIINERTHIGAQPTDIATEKPGGVVLGSYVVVEVGAVIEAGNTEIGDGSIIQVGSRIGSGAKIGKVTKCCASCHMVVLIRRSQHCTISHMSIIPPGEVLPDHTVVFSNGTRRLDRRSITEMKKHALVKQLAVIRKMIPSNPDKFK